MGEFLVSLANYPQLTDRGGLTVNGTLAEVAESPWREATAM